MDMWMLYPWLLMALVVIVTWFYVGFFMEPANKDPQIPDRLPEGFE